MTNNDHIPFVNFTFRKSTEIFGRKISRTFLFLTVKQHFISIIIRYFCNVTEIFHIFYGNLFLITENVCIFTEKKQRKTELLEIFLPEKNRNFREITEIFPSRKVIEAHLLHLTKCLTP